MKYLASLLLLLISLCANATDMVIQTNGIYVDFGDSFRYAPDQNPNTGCRAFEYWDSGVKLMFPYKNTHGFNLGRAGLNMDTALTSSVPVSMGLFAYQSNSFQHLGGLPITDNGSLSSNQAYLSISNIYQAPGLIARGVTDLQLTNNGGQFAKPINWISLGYPGNYAADAAYSTEGARNYASVNAGNNLGYFSVNSFDGCSNMIATDFVTGGHNWDWVFPSGVPHFLSGGGKAWGDVGLVQMFPSMSNLTTCVVDWNGAGASGQNCLISSIVTGSILTFDCIEYSMGPAWDHPGDIVRDGTITNNADISFNLNGNYGEYFKQIIQILNIPAGTYYVKEDGETVATLSSTVLAAGWNRGTNTIGPSWRKRVLVLADIRDTQGENQVHLTHTSSGVFNYGSTSTSFWPGTQGDAFVAVMNSAAKVCFDLDDIANADAQPVTRHMSIVLANSYQPIGFR